MQIGKIQRQVRVEHLMGTVFSFDVRDAVATEAIAAAIDGAVAWLRAADARFSTYRADSEINRLDRGELRVADATPDVRWVLARCADLRDRTDGFFSVRAAGRLDPSALVKGWAIQGAADRLAAAGLEHFCLSGGGDVVVRGGALPATTWRVGVQHPDDRAAVAATLTVSDLAVATSGAYERGAHIVDPHTGAAPAGVRSVTVTGPDLGTADAYATAAFAMGADGPAWTLRLGDGYEALTILDGETVVATPGFPAAPAPEARA
jgi:thiamine biosynthesis lipoprotein